MMCAVLESHSCQWLCLQQALVRALLDTFFVACEGAGSQDGKRVRMCEVCTSTTVSLCLLAPPITPASHHVSVPNCTYMHAGQTQPAIQSRAFRDLARLWYARLGLFSQHGILCQNALPCPCNTGSVHAYCFAGSMQPGMPGLTLALQHGISELMAPQPGTRMV